MQPVQSVAIIGAGNMGSGIAQKTAQEEYDVQMVDREAQWVERKTIISDFLSEAVERRIFSPTKLNGSRSNYGRRWNREIRIRYRLSNRSSVRRFRYQECSIQHTKRSLW